MAHLAAGNGRHPTQRTHLHFTIPRESRGRNAVPDVGRQLRAVVRIDELECPGRFVKNPDFQFRDFGTSTPVVSFSRNSPGRRDPGSPSP